MNKVTDMKRRESLEKQIPKMEQEIKSLKKAVSGLLKEDEIDPKSEYFVLAKSLVAKTEPVDMYSLYDD